VSRQKLLGDYQTPLPLARQIARRLFAPDANWGRVLEPTCGSGNFIRACLELSEEIQEIIGCEIQAPYVERAREIQPQNPKISVLHRNIFDLDLASSLPWTAKLPLLIIGNPPWVTNSAQGRLNGRNLPQKSNFQNLRGLDAITGKANFDIAESIWLKLLADFASEPVTIALLCKTSVARRVMRHIYQAKLPVIEMSLYLVNAKKWFGVAVDAGLFLVKMNGAGQLAYEANIFDSLDCARASKTVGFRKGKIVADLRRYQAVSYLEGQCQFEWRQGLKHDASAVMELRLQDGEFKNGYGLPVDVEAEYIYPLMKSSDARASAKGFSPRKYVIVPQARLQQNTALLKRSAPKLWAYLNDYRQQLDARKSAIYRNRPRFSVFGVGDYTFAKYKIVVSGFYLPIHFALLCGQNKKAIVADDTCYFLTFSEAWPALIVGALLGQAAVSEFVASIAFSDSKRPVTKQLLSRIDLRAVYETCNHADVIAAARNLARCAALNATVPADERSIKALFERQPRLL